jgi:hypothetical protein
MAEIRAENEADPIINQLGVIGREFSVDQNELATRLGMTQGACRCESVHLIRNSRHFARSHVPWMARCISTSISTTAPR